jgi:hypothetical protein
VAISKNLTAWKAAPREEQVLADEGNILRPLERVRDQYTHKAEELDEKMPGPGASDPKTNFDVSACLLLLPITGSARTRFRASSAQ